MNEKGKICVFGASSKRIERSYTDEAYKLGRLIAQNGFGCINGAGAEGLMRAVSDGVLDAGGTVTGVIPQFMVENRWNYDRITETIVTPDMHTRKEKMVELSCGIITLPGGCGTMEELLEMFTWRQLGIINKPLIVLNTLGYYTPLFEMMKRSVVLGFMNDVYTRIWRIAKSPREAIDIMMKELSKGTEPLPSKLPTDIE